MTRIFCDRCETELRPNELIGKVEMMERSSTIAITTPNSSTAVIKTWVLCESCSNNLKKHLEKNKK